MRRKCGKQREKGVIPSRGTNTGFGIRSPAHLTSLTPPPPIFTLNRTILRRGKKEVFLPWGIPSRARSLSFLTFCWGLWVIEDSSLAIQKSEITQVNEAKKFYVFAELCGTTISFVTLDKLQHCRDEKYKII